jgi:hypothetical protein
VKDNVAAVRLQFNELAHGLLNKPLLPVRSDGVCAARFLFAAAVALQGSINVIKINNEKVARAITGMSIHGEGCPAECGWPGMSG